MNHHRFLRLVGVLLLAALLLTGCAGLFGPPLASPAAPSPAPQAGDPAPANAIDAAPGSALAEEALAYLTGEECFGRLVGTAGNENALRYVEDKLLAMGFAPLFGESLRVPYVNTDTINVEQSDYAVFLLDASGNEEALVAGADYFPYWYADEFDLTAPIAHEGGALEGKAVVFEGGSAGDPLATASVVIYAGVAPSARLHKGAQGQARGALLTEAGLEKLKAAAEIRIRNRCEYADTQQNNLVAVMRGKSSNRALVLGAHFDHLGGIGGSYYQGAIDNAAGVATLLATAQALAQTQIQSECDIVFCAFNGEEQGRKGSVALAPALAEEYAELAMINLDCVALAAGAGQYSLQADKPSAVGGALDRALTEAGLKRERINPVYSSDNISFAGIGVDAVCLDTPGWDGLVHSPSDTPALISAAHMNTLASTLSTLAAEYDFSCEPVELYDKEQADACEHDALAALTAQIHADTGLAYDEKYYFEHGAQVYVTTGNRALTSLEEIEAYFPGAKLPNEAAGLPLSRLAIFSFNQNGIDFARSPGESPRADLCFITPEEGLNTVIKRDCFNPTEYMWVEALYESEDYSLRIAIHNTGSATYDVNPMRNENSYSIKTPLEGEYEGVTLLSLEQNEYFAFDCFLGSGEPYVFAQYYPRRTGRGVFPTQEELYPAIDAVLGDLPQNIIEQLSQTG